MRGLKTKNIGPFLRNAAEDLLKRNKLKQIDKAVSLFLNDAVEETSEEVENSAGITMATCETIHSRFQDCVEDVIKRANAYLDGNKDHYSKLSLFVVDALYGLKKEKWDTEMWKEKEFSEVLNFVEVRRKLQRDNETNKILVIDLFSLLPQNVKNAVGERAQDVALVVHVSDKQIHHLLTILEKKGWLWVVNTWVKQVATFVQGANVRYDSEYWVLCYNTKNPPVKNIEGAEEQR